MQARGNGGGAPIETAPTSGAHLPVSSSGGVGTTTVTQIGTNGSGTVGSLAKFVTNHSLGNANLSQDVTTSGSTAATVVGIQTTPVSNAVPRKGDTLRYNEYGDSKWDLCYSPGRFIALCGGTTTLSNMGISSGSGQLGSTSAPLPIGDNDVFPTTFSNTAAASTSTRIGANMGVNGSGGIMTPNCINRYSLLWTPTSTTNVRYWMGLSQALSLGTTTFANQTPNTIYAAFRYTAGTDTHYQAACGTATANQTIVDTGVSLDTTLPHLFEIVPGPGLSNWYFYIDGALVATISSNLPVASNRLGAYWTADNLNTANTTLATHYNMSVSLT